MQNCSRQLAMQSCVLCSFVRCGTKKKNKKGFKHVNSVTDQLQSNLSPTTIPVNSRVQFRSTGDRFVWKGDCALVNAKRYHRSYCTCQVATAYSPKKQLKYGSLLTSQYGFLSCFYNNDVVGELN